MKLAAWLTWLKRAGTTIVGLALIAGLILAFAFWLWPSWQTIQKTPSSQEALHLEGERVRLETELVKTCAQIVLGALVIGTLYLTWRRVRAAEQTVEVALEGQITERFTRAVVQLGNQDNIAIRLGGIYALERIARDSERDHCQVMEILTAFVRKESPHREDIPLIQPIAADIQAILTVMGRRNPKYDRNGLRLDLSDTHLHGARLMDANLEHMMFSGANLRNAAFFRVNFRGAIFQGTVLQGTTFQKSNLTKCIFDRAEMLGTNLQGSDITDSDLSEAKYLTKEQIEAAVGGRSAQLPTHLQDM